MRNSLAPTTCPPAPPPRVVIEPMEGGIIKTLVPLLLKNNYYDTDVMDLVSDVFALGYWKQVGGRGWGELRKSARELSVVLN